MEEDYLIMIRKGRKNKSHKEIHNKEEEGKMNTEII